ncbi:hypothetical protein ACFL5O_09065 [Myxococcota bacterium]
MQDGEQFAGRGWRPLAAFLRLFSVPIATGGGRQPATASQLERVTIRTGVAGRWLLLGRSWAVLPLVPVRCWVVRVAFRRKVVDNAAMSHGTLMGILLLAVAGVTLGGCDKKKKEPIGAASDSATPKPPGVQEGGGCTKHEDCDEGLRCADDKTCQTPKTIDCRGRADTCGDDGRCLGKNGKCVPASDEACKKSRRCETDGRCTSKDDKCMAASPADCAKLCEATGRCTVQDGSCIAASHKDCRDSVACKTAKRCRALAGRCVGR